MCCVLQAWYAGWAEPVADVNSTNLPAGTWKKYSIPAYMSTKTNLIRVGATANPPSAQLSFEMCMHVSLVYTLKPRIDHKCRLGMKYVCLYVVRHGAKVFVCVSGDRDRVRRLWAHKVVPSGCLQVVPSWRTGGGPSFIFSYRQPVGRDALLDPLYMGRCAGSTAEHRTRTMITALRPQAVLSAIC